MTVGAQLQEARALRRLSLSDVAKETKIQPWVLEALEADRLPEQMSPIYVKGFLTSYAKFLHLEPEPFLAELRVAQPVAEQPTVAPAASQPIPVARTVSWSAIRRLTLGVAASVAVAALVVFNPVRLVSGPVKQWMAKVSQAMANRPKVKVAQRPKATRAANGAQAKATQASEPVAPAPKLASLAQLSEPITPPAPAAPALVPVEPLELTVKAQRTTWIQVRADGKLLTQQRLPRGANERWVAKKRFDLIVANPSQVDVTLNGQPISAFAIAHHGRLKITHTGITPLPAEAP